MTDNSFGRLAGALVSPRRTFESIETRPTWLVALLVLILGVGSLGLAVHQRTDYRESLTRSLEARGIDSMSEYWIEQGVEMAERFGALNASLQALLVGGLFCLFAVFYWGVFHLRGSDLTYKQSLATCVHGALPLVVYWLLAALVVLSRGDLSYEKLSARDFLPSHLGVFAPEGAGMLLRSFLTGIDVFALWSVILLILGYRVVAKVSTVTVGVVVTVFWLLGLRVGFAWLGAGGMR